MAASRRSTCNWRKSVTKIQERAGLKPRAFHISEVALDADYPIARIVLKFLRVRFQIIVVTLFYRPLTPLRPSHSISTDEPARRTPADGQKMEA